MRAERLLLKNRKRGAGPVATLATPSPSNGLDKWLSRLSSASQPLLLPLATFGYFYTVVPIYQKEMLSEQIAAKEKELSRLQRQIDQSGPVITGLRDQVEVLNAQTHVLESERLRTETAIAELNALRVKLSKENETLANVNEHLTQESLTAKAEVVKTARRMYHESFSGTVSLIYLDHHTDESKVVDAPTYAGIQQLVLTPYAAISAALSKGDSIFIPGVESLPRKIKDEYHSFVRNQIENRRGDLEKPQDDINALLFQIQQEMASAASDPTPKDKFNEKYFETKAKMVQILSDLKMREMQRTQQFMESLALLLDTKVR